MNIASYIDYTLLSPTTTETDIVKLCEEALTYRFAAVCVPPYYVSEAVKKLRDTPVKIATVIGFPLGYHSVASKLAEIEKAIEAGVDELDMVINLAALKSASWNDVAAEIKTSTRYIHAHHKIIKIIIETGLLTKEEILKCCNIGAENGVDFMKTSTGFVATGATVQMIEMMRNHLPEDISIKASGGIRTFAFAKKLLDAGAHRLGCSASVKIVNEAQL